MPSADQVPVKSSHSTMQWHLWVVLIAGSTGSALRAVRPPNLHITPDDSQRDLYYAASATGSLYRSPLAIMAQAILAILLASATAATFVGRRANNAVSHGRCLVGSVPSVDHAVELQNLRLEHPQLGAERDEAGARNFRQPLVTCVSDDPEQFLNTIATDRRDDPELGKMGTDRIDHRGLLADE